MNHHHNPAYLHHKKPGFAVAVREVVFGSEDGMVSTMGAITGIAIGSGNHFVVVLSGMVIIAVESISMAVGSYLSSKSQREVEQRMVEEEKEEIARYPEEEKKEMQDLLTADGWPPTLAAQMAEEGAKHPRLMLKEMMYRELCVVPEERSSPVKNGMLMWGSYILGGLVPIIPYVFLPSVAHAMPVSVGITFIGLFALGVGTSKFSRRSAWRAGAEMVLLAGLAAVIGAAVGILVDRWLF